MWAVGIRSPSYGARVGGGQGGADPAPERAQRADGRHEGQWHGLDPILVQHQDRARARVGRAGDVDHLAPVGELVDLERELGVVIEANEHRTERGAVLLVEAVGHRLEEAVAGDAPEQARLRLLDEAAGERQARQQPGEETGQEEQGDQMASATMTP